MGLAHPGIAVPAIPELTFQNPQEPLNQLGLIPDPKITYFFLPTTQQESDDIPASSTNYTLTNLFGTSDYRATVHAETCAGGGPLAEVEFMTPTGPRKDK